MRRTQKLFFLEALVAAMAIGGALGPSLFGAGAATGTSTTGATTNSTGTFKSNQDATHESGESAAREAAESNTKPSAGPTPLHHAEVGPSPGHVASSVASVVLHP